MNGTETEETVSITSNELKETNLIFVEHEMLLKENSLLIEQIENYKEDNELLLKANELREQQIENYQGMNSVYMEQIEGLKQEVKQKNKALLGWKIGGITVSVGLLLFLLLK